MKKNTINIMMVGGYLLANTINAYSTNLLKNQSEVTNNTQVCFTENKGQVSTEQQNGTEKIYFTENKGQIVDQNYMPRPDVLYSGNSESINFYLRKKGITYQILQSSNTINYCKSKGDLKTKSDSITFLAYRIDLNLLNANDNNIDIINGNQLGGYSNYYTAGCATNGVLGVKSFESVTYKNIYNGMDLKWYSQNGILKYDYLCAAGADFSQIKVEVLGADSLYIAKNGAVKIITPFGVIEEKAPVVYQGGKILDSKWKLDGNVLSFFIYNLNNRLAYVIDPFVRLFGSYYGGTGQDYSYHSSTDASNNFYITGSTTSPSSTLIATTGAHQTTFGGNWDAYVAKFNSSGVRQWATYYGGTGDDRGYGNAVASDGSVYACGHAQSTSGISAGAVFQSAHGGGIFDCFLVKFNSAGVRQWCTYFGGTSEDYGRACSIDNAGTGVYLTGYTSSSGLATAGAHQLTLSGPFDAILAKFTTAGARTWSTYYGGTGTDYGRNCKCDASNNVYLTGYTTSGNAISTAGAHQITFGGTSDGFLIKFNSAGTRQFGTYYGGANFDDMQGLSIDATGINCSGYSESTSAISTAGAHQVFNGGSYDAFLVRFNLLGVRQWGTYFGGAGLDESFANSFDASTGDIFLSGDADATTGSVLSLPGEHQVSHVGSADSFLARFTNSGTLLSCTYYGGSGNEYSYSCPSDGAGNVYLVGQSSTTSGTSIATAGAHQSNYGTGTYDGFFAKFSSTVIILPIVLSEFEGKSLTGNKAKLNWKTLSEINSSYYRIEKSKNGVEFVTLFDVQSTNNPIGSNYEVIDEYFEEPIAYYRLKHIGKNGNEDYKKTIALNNSSKEIIFINLTDKVIIKNISFLKFESLKIIDVSGRVIKKFDLQELNNSDFQFNKEELHTGIYFINFDTQNSNMKSYKFEVY